MAAYSLHANHKLLPLDFFWGKFINAKIGRGADRKSENLVKVMPEKSTMPGIQTAAMYPANKPTPMERFLTKPLKTIRQTTVVINAMKAIRRYGQATVKS